MASVIGARRTVRVVAVQLGIDQTVVFDLDQSEAEAEASKRPPAEATVKDLPPYPSAEPVFFVQDDRASMGAVVYRTPAGADTVQKFYEGALRGAGWKSVAPERGLREQSLRVYVSNDRVCCVLVEASRTEGMSRITVLHKERGIEY